VWFNKLILVDVDNVMFDFNTPFYDWVEAEKNLVPNGARNSSYRFEHLYGTTEAEMVAHVEEFSNGENFGMLPPMPGAVEAIDHLKKAGYAFEAITACCDAPAVREAREKALRATYGISDIHYVGLGQNKFSMLSKYKPSFWVEDNLKNAMDGSMAGHYTFLIDHEYNRGTERGIHRVAGWADIEAAIAEMA